MNTDAALFTLAFLSFIISAAVQEAPAGTISFYGKTVSFVKMLGQNRVGEFSDGAVTAKTMNHPGGVAVDRSSRPNRVYVADNGNSRILGFATPDREQADLIFGQPDAFSGAPNGDCNVGRSGKTSREKLCLMNAPEGTNTAEQWMFGNLDVDNAGNLYVADVYNNRVLIFRSPFSTEKSGGKGDTLPDFVLGQPNFESNKFNHGQGNPAADSLYLSFGGFDHVSSRGVSVDATGNVWVADAFNYRVLRFPKGATVADLVIGQRDFSAHEAVVELAKAPLDRLCTPICARIDPENGELYVIDEHPTGFKARVLIFTPPFTNGMRASRIFVPKQELAGDFAAGYQLTHATSLAFNSFKTDDVIGVGTGTHRYRDGVVWLQDDGRSRRTLLLDREGTILLAVGAPDLISLGCSFARYGQCGQTPERPYNLGWPGGSIGFDSANRIYLADGTFHRVARFSLPYALRREETRVCLPNSSGGFGAGPLPNAIRATHLATENLGMAAHRGQLILRDHQRYLVWNDYAIKPSARPADIIVGQPVADALPERNHIHGRSMHAVDHEQRLWSFSEHGLLMAYQLPLTPTSQPLRDLAPLYWADAPEEKLPPPGGIAIAFEAATNSLWVFDAHRHRLLRVRLPRDLMDKLLVDVVLGQKNKSDDAVNHGLDRPDAASFGDVNDLRFDHAGNLFVVDNTYELHDNGRIIAFVAADLQKIATMFPAITAKKVYVATGFDQPVHRRILAPGQNPTSPVSIAFNTRNEMVVGNDGYFPDSTMRHLNQLYFYRHPLEKPTPDAVIELPMGAPGEITFDGANNLLVQDHTWHKVWVINLDRDKAWLRKLANAGVASR